MLRLLKEVIGVNLFNSELGSAFLDMTRAQATEEK